MFFQKPVRVLCIGSASKDIFFPTDEGILLETPEDVTAQKKIAFELGGKYRVADRYEAVGGVAANVAQGLARLGIRTGIYSNVGQDEMGRWIRESLERAGVSTRTLFLDTEASTDLSAIIVMMQNGERTIFHNRDANERLRIIPQKIKKPEWFFISSLNGEWEANLRHILEIASARGVSLAYNPGQHNLRDNPELVLEVIARSKVLVLNKDEAIELLLKSGAPLDPEKINDEASILLALSKAGAGIIGMTDGARGAWGYDGTEMWYCPIRAVDRVVDATGAGDAFGAAFFAAFLLGKNLPDMLGFGIAESGSVVREYGASEGLLSLSALEALSKEVKQERLS